MKRAFSFLLAGLLCLAASATAENLKPRLTWDKYIFAEGVNPKARYLDRLMVKFYDEDLVRIAGDRLVSRTGTDLSSVNAFLERHPEVTLELTILSEPEDEYQARTAEIERKSGIDLVDLFSFTRFRLPEPDADPKGLLAEVLAAPEVELAYYEGIPVDGLCQDWGQVTPDYVPDQEYHDPAPEGTDLDYAQSAFGADVVDGSGTGVWTGIFERGMQTTHENVTSAVVATAGTPDADNDHGTAVMGIMGGCDDNGVGVLGYLADQAMRLYQRNSAAYGSVADVYNFANGQLLAGEVTNSSWGYFSNPMPPGQACPCNPGQNGTVPIEYDAGVKAAVQAGVADGIHYFVITHNGCTDLDDPIFGNIFQYATDTGSNYVGAGESAVVGDGHDAACFTSFGSRVNHYAWGEDIYTSGYGTLWAGDGPDEWYRATFGGSSGASPIVAGCGGVLNNIWRDEHAGDNIGPTTLRSWLGTHATPNNDDATVPIGMMPNLFGILAPDLAPYQIGGWDADLVPNNTQGDHTIPANLSPTPATTYVQWGWVNWSRFSGCDALSYVYLDDVWIVGGSNYLPPYSATYIDSWDTAIRGGLHYLRQTEDPLGDVTESDEDNNDSVHLYVWDGMPLVKDVPQTFTRGPKRNPQGATDYAKDGFYNNGNLAGLWEVYAVMPESSGDYDMGIYDEAPTSTTGFQASEAYSAFVTYTDFVGANQNQAGVGSPVWVGATNYSDTSEDYTIEGDASTYVGSLSAYPVLEASGSLDAGEILDVYEFYAYAGDEAWIHLEVTGGNGDLAVCVFGPDAEYFDRYDIDWYFNSGGDGDSETGSLTVGTTGYHGVVLIKHMRDEIDEYIDYDFYLGEPAGDLIHYTRAGWTHELVARNSGVGSTGVLPAILNEGNSVADAGYYNQGSGTFASGSNAAIYLDGPQVHVSGDFVAIGPGMDGQISNRDLGYVTGGRHELGGVADVNEEVPEEPPLGEENNEFYTQYAWAPYALTDLVPVTRDPAPNFRNFDHSFTMPGYNQDGYVFSTSYWTGVGFVPIDNTDDYVSMVYDNHSTDPENAMLTFESIAWAGVGNTTFCLANGNVVGNGQQKDFGLTNNYGWPGTPSISDYAVEGCQRIGDCMSDQLYGPFALGNGHILHVYDLNIPAAGDYPVSLFNDSGADLGIAIFEAGQDYVGSWNATCYLDVGGAGADETGTLTTTTSGWHGLVVFKHGFADRTLNAQYRFLVGERTPMPVTDLTITPVELDPGDGTYHFDFQFSDVTQDIYGAPLVVDYYSIYWSYDPYTAFPGGWTFFTTSPVSEFLNIPTVTDPYLYFRVTAVDEDGVIVASSGPLGPVSREKPGGQPQQRK